MDPLSLLAGVLAGVGATATLVLSVLNIREKLWPTPAKPHPLEQAVREIALAIRERQQETP